MNNNTKSNLNMPLYEKSDGLLLNIDQIGNSILTIAQKLHEVIQPLYIAIENYAPRIIDIGQKVIEANRSLVAISQMSDAQFVCWDYMNNKTMNELAYSRNINKTLRQYMEKDKYSSVYKTVEESCTYQAMKKHLRLYLQSVEAFKTGKYDLAVTGFTSVFDGVLAELSENTAASLTPRISIIKSKLDNCDILQYDEYAMLVLVLTFDSTLDSFSAKSDFSKKEPKKLNRHWIAHGRSLRRKTKLDCVKMINLLYGLLLITRLADDSSMHYAY